MPILLLIFTLSAIGGPQTAMQAPLPELLLESSTARALAVSVGDTVYVSSAGGAAAGERAFVVAGTYRRPADPATATLRDYRAIFHLPDLAGLLAGGDRVDRFSVRLRAGADRAAAIAEIDRLAFGAQALPTEVVADATSETFRVVSRFHRALAGITISGSAVFLLCLVLLKVSERRLEGAAMREIGISRRTLFLWIFAETMAMAALGTGAGLGLGWLGSAIINAYFRRFYDTPLAFARVTPELALAAAAIGLAAGAAIGVLAGGRMVRSAPARLRER